MSADRTVLFLPGAGGAAEFWHPVGALLPESWGKVYLSWPGLGDEPPDPAIGTFDDLAGLVETQLTAGCDVVAQSLGGIVAVRVVLRNPTKVRRLVLVATSGGLDVPKLGGTEWRDAYRRAHPQAAAWITTEHADHTADFRRIRVPTLLIWGDRDEISPPSVGRALRALLPSPSMRVLAGGTHSLAVERPNEVAALIAGHLGPGKAGSPCSA
jgi:pimeloyl-ACP methyl ester carboxylesterase